MTYKVFGGMLNLALSILYIKAEASAFSHWLLLSL